MFLAPHHRAFARTALPLVGCLLWAGCMPKQRPQDMPEEIPKWKSEEGRKKTWRDMARWYNDNNLPGEALEMVQRLRESGEDTVELSIIQGRSLAAQGLPSEARNVLETIVDKHPRNAEVLQSLGVVYADLNEVDLAIRTFERALQLDETHTPTRNNLGFLLLAQGRCDEAVTHLSQVIEDDGTSARYRNNLAFALVCSGDQERALKLFRSTADEADARYNMGVAFERVDALDNAILQYEHALRYDPDHAAAMAALARLSLDASPPPDGVE